jgi:hypothetical protein
VLLAPTTDPDKAFRSTTEGVVLGVHYNTVDWTWHIPAEKLARLLGQIREIDSRQWIRQHELWSVVGRILHYAPLIPGGKFNISELIAAHASTQDRMDWVEPAGQAPAPFLVALAENNARPHLHSPAGSIPGLDVRVLH